MPAYSLPPRLELLLMCLARLVITQDSCSMQDTQRRATRARLAGDVVLKQVAPGEHLPHDHAEGVHVARLGQLPVAQQLGCTDRYSAWRCTVNKGNGGREPAMQYVLAHHLTTALPRCTSHHGAKTTGLCMTVTQMACTLLHMRQLLRKHSAQE